MLQGITANQFGIGHITFNKSLTEKSAARREDFAARAKNPEPGLRQNISVNTLQTHTRINGHVIPRVIRPLYAPVFTQADCTAHLTHAEWWASLDDDVRSIIASCGDGGHLARATSEERFGLVSHAKWRLEWGGAEDEYFNRVREALTELGQSMGLQLSSWAMASQGSQAAQFTLAHFNCPNGNNGRVVAILNDGRKIITEVPPGFTQDDFNRLQEDIQRRLEGRELNRPDAPLTKLEEFFEEAFEEIFGEV